jgi:hypothetical protein
MTGHKLIHLGEPVGEDDAVTRKYVDNTKSTVLARFTDDPMDVLSKFAGYLKRDGSSAMIRSLNTGSRKVNNVGEAIRAQNVVRMNYLDSLTGSSHLHINGNKINNPKEPATRSDEVTEGFEDNLLVLRPDGSAPMSGELNLDGCAKCFQYELYEQYISS